MRFKIYFELENVPTVFTNNYSYLISSCIKNQLKIFAQNFADKTLSSQYNYDYRNFKLLTYSRLKFKKIRIKNNKFNVISNEVSLELSFISDKLVEKFVDCLFSLGSMTLYWKCKNFVFNIKKVIPIKEPKFKDEMIFSTISPICIKKLNIRTYKYDCLETDNKYYSNLLLESLVKRYIDYKKFLKEEKNPNDFDISKYKFEILTEPKQCKMITNESRNECPLIAYDYKFKINAPVEILKIAYYTGVGSSNFQGMGCVKNVIHN